MKNKYWLDDQFFDDQSLDPDSRMNPWDHWVGNQTPKDFIIYSNTSDIEDAVEKYVDDCPRMFPEAAGEVSRAWLYTQLLRYLRANL